MIRITRDGLVAAVLSATVLVGAVGALATHDDTPICWVTVDLDGTLVGVNFNEQAGTPTDCIVKVMDPNR